MKGGPLTAQCVCGKELVMQPLSVGMHGREIYVHYEMPEGWTSRKAHPEPDQVLCSETCRQTPDHHRTGD
jgi:hypothetical protein